MFLPKPIKTSVIFAVLFCQACGSQQNRANRNANTPFAADELKTAIPFSSKEPDVYQAEIVLTNYAGGEKSEHKIFTARSGAKLRCDYENEISFLQLDENRRFSIHNRKKIYVEYQTNQQVSNETGETLKDFLTTEWLNEKRSATFENLGAENNLTKYRVKPEGTPSDASENLIYVDENLKIPVRQEFYTTNGEQKTLVFSMELRNFKPEADDKLFELPKDFRKVSADEFQKTIRQEN